MRVIDFFYSDPHFGHRNILEFSERPFRSLEEHDEVLIERYNATVGPKQTCLWLGDCFFCGFERAEQIMSRLHGRKLLVRGNHDRSPSRMASIGFDLVTEVAWVDLGGHRAMACHYPYRRQEREERFANLRPWRQKGLLLLHGHVHSRRRLVDGQIHVGVDAWDYRPVAFHEAVVLGRVAFGEAA